MKVQLLQIWRRMIDKMCCSSQFWLSHWGSWKCGFSGPHSILNVEMLIWAQFFPQLRKIQWSLRSGLVGVGPLYALFFYLLRCPVGCFYVVWYNRPHFWLFAVLCFSWRLYMLIPLESYFATGFLSLWRVQVLTRRWTSYFCCLFSALPDLGGLGESASHPTSSFSLWKGECHKLTVYRPRQFTFHAAARSVHVVSEVLSCLSRPGFYLPAFSISIERGVKFQYFRDFYLHL